MICELNHQEFLRVIKTCFSFLVTEFGFEIGPVSHIGNRYTGISYSDGIRKLATSVDIIDGVSLRIRLLEDGEEPHYDDETRNLNLNSLNRRIFPHLSREEILTNKETFAHIHPESDFEKAIKNVAFEIRLALLNWDKLGLPEQFNGVRFKS